MKKSKKNIPGARDADASRAPALSCSLVAVIIAIVVNIAIFAIIVVVVDGCG
jgi:hypothetical protein